jgi:glycosyltransferase involved in cell wall biosynthesis
VKVVLLHYAAPPVVGGVETVIGHQARLLAESGHAVSVVAGRGAQTDAGVEFVQLPLADSRNPEVLRVKSDLDAGRVPEQFAPLVDRTSAALSEITTGADWIIAHNVCSLNKNLVLTAALRRIADRPGPPRLILWHHDLAWTTPRYRDELHAGYPWDLLRTAWPGALQVTISEFRRRELSS